MKILIKSINLFLFGIYIEAYKRNFDRKIDRRISRGKDISSKSLTAQSDRCYYLYAKFREAEKNLNFDIIQKATLRHI